MSNTNKSVGPLWHEPVLVPIIFTARFRLPGIPTVLDIHSTYSTSDFRVVTTAERIETLPGIPDSDLLAFTVTITTRNKHCDKVFRGIRILDCHGTFARVVQRSLQEFASRLFA
jgi:hypothetical protein